MDPKSRTTIGRMPVEKAIRLVGPPADDAAKVAAPSKGVVCERCGAVICDPVRAKLFAGMVLKCNACGESRKI